MSSHVLLFLLGIAPLLLMSGCGDDPAPAQPPALIQLETHEFRTKLKIIRAEEGKTFGALAEFFVRGIMDQLPSQIRAVINKHPRLTPLASELPANMLPIKLTDVPGPIPLHLPQRLRMLAEAAYPALAGDDAESIRSDISDLILDAALKTLSAAVERIKSALSEFEANEPPDAWLLQGKRPKNLYGWLYRMQRRQLSKSSVWDVRVGDFLAGGADKWHAMDDPSTISIGRLFREILQVPDMVWAFVVLLRYGPPSRYAGETETMLQATHEGIVQLAADRVRRGWNRIIVGMDDYLFWEYERVPEDASTPSVPRGPQQDQAGPSITVIHPPAGRGLQLVPSNPTLEVKLAVDDPSGVKSVSINGDLATKDARGHYTRTITLRSASSVGGASGGAHTRLDIVAEDTHGNQRTYSAAIAQVDGNATLETGRRGQDYALLVGVDDYEHWTPLHNPVRDATTIRDVLRDTYGFKTELLLDPTKAQLQHKVLEYVNKAFGNDDQVFFFFAGHGHYDVPPLDLGYLVFKDTPKADMDPLRDAYLRHDSLLVLLDRIKCPHLLVVLDSCFGGNAFGARLGGVRGAVDVMSDIDIDDFVKRKLKLRTRKLITSGGTEYVWDGPKDQHSPFAHRLLRVLRSLDDKPEGVVTIADIVGAVEMGNPGAISGSLSGDDPGSDFLFIKRR